MSIDKCLAEAVMAGKLSHKGMNEYLKHMGDAEKVAAQRGMAGPDAYTFAVTEAAKAMEKRATSNKKQVQQTILAIDRAWEAAQANTRGVGWGLTTIFGERVGGSGTAPSIGLQSRGNLKTAQSIMADFMAKVQSKAFGLKQERDLPKQVVSELYGRKTGGEGAAEGAKAWEATMKWWRDGMERAGVFVPELKDWRLPQNFDPGAVKHLGKDGFVQQMTDWWTSNKLLLRDWEADATAYFRPGDPAATARAREIFETAYDNITTKGEANLEPGALTSKTLADRYGRRRAFEWATDEAWLEFNNKLGVGDDAIGEAMVRHIDHITRDLAVAQVLGPDPDRTAKTLIQMYRQQNASKPGGASLGQGIWANRLEALYEINSGKAQAPVSQRLALAGQSTRHFLSSVQLGGAVLSSMSDFAFTKATASWHGLDMSRIMVDYLSNLRPQNMEDRVAAMRGVSLVEVGLRGMADASRDAINDVRTRVGASGKVDAGLNGLSRITGRMAEFVIRAQGLAHHTQMMRNAIGGEVQAHWGAASGKTWDQLSAIDRRTMTDYGMGQKEWDILRTKAVKGGLLDPTIIARGDDAAARDAGVKMLGAISAIERMAIPEGNSVTKAVLLGANRPGTPEGEFLRSFGQYKGFPMSAMIMHWARATEALADGEGKWARGQYIASLAVGATVMGAVSLQLKNIAAGKDPEPMFSQANRARFWASAFAQGGFGGIIGDQIKAMLSASKSGDASRMLTPTGGLLLDTLNLTRGNFGERLAGVDPHFGREAVRYANKYTPDVWYTKLAMDRLVWDTLTKMADPEAVRTFARMQERARKEQETQFYWRPGSANVWQGDTGLRRGPNVLNAARGLVDQ